MATKTSSTMEQALEIARRDGAVVAGRSEHKGRVERVAASTLRALAGRGLVVLFTGPDGGVAARLPETK